MENIKIHYSNFHRIKDKENNNTVFKLFKCNFCRKLINPYKTSYIQLLLNNKTKEYLHPDCYVNAQCNGVVYYNTDYKITEANSLDVNDINDFDQNVSLFDLS